MDVTIREYRSTDFQACCLLQGELAAYHAEIYDDPAIAEGDPAQAFEEYLSRPDRCVTWLAETEGNIVGFAGLIDVVGEQDTAEIEPVVIASIARGEGIGTRLIKYVVEEATKKGFRFLTIRPVLRNEEAFHLYVKLGFDHVGSIQLFQELDPKSQSTWKSGISVHGEELKY